MFAEVVIDIKHTDVNQTYDYIIPQAFEGFLTRGMRVMVPFGTMMRLGFIVKIKEISDRAEKEIASILDTIPTIDDELFLLIDHMEHTSASLISSLFQEVIPDVCLVSYQKVVTVLNIDEIPADIEPYFNTKGIWKLKTRDQVFYPRLKRLQDKKIVRIETHFREKKTEKWETYYTYNPHHLYPKIDRYEHIIALFHEHPLKQRSALISDGISVSTLNTLIKHDVLFEEKREVKRNISVPRLESKEIILNQEQTQAVNEVKYALESNTTFLLKGITGSGKTEVYLKLIKEVEKTGKKTLLLVPEIQLITPMAERLLSHDLSFAIYHSALSKGERYDQYKSIQKGEVSVILGTRSAIFLPIEDLGLIIIDEEHDESYRQTEGVIYDARDLAKIRADFHHIPLLFGSATPSIVTMYDALHGKIALLELKKRATNLPLPKLTFVDMKQELKDKHLSIFSRPLIAGLKNRLENHEQSILFLNRKGYAPFVLCRACGDVPTCPHCDVSLRFYKDKKMLKCPYCGYEKEFSATCDRCHEPKVKEIGIGIEYVEEQLKKVFPKARILRLDHEMTTTKHAHEVIWHDFHQKEADILIGTQMVTKGLDFPGVTLVGVLMSDLLLKIPSYQSTERAFMMLTQATGRSGRALEGEAIIQGYDLGHYAIQAVEKGYDAFYQEAIQSRKLLGYKPFKETSQLLFEGKGFLKTYQKAFMLKKKLDKLGFTALGPSQALIKKMKDQYRFTITLKYDPQDLTPLFKMIQDQHDEEIMIRFSPILDQW
ncbi:MAG: primosomal protein N' [Acholeplasma sp.]|jgi:primosomal protein N' (replication factor Y)|nr:MAG: primosomal protein N' [Acholeplasma sp.]